MKRFVFLFPVLAAIGLYSCGGGVSQDKVRQHSNSSIETSRQYFQDQQKKYEDGLNSHIKSLDENILKLKDVSSENKQQVGGDLQTSIGKLLDEKTRLQQELKELQARTEDASQSIDGYWKLYNQSLDSNLNSMGTYYKTLDPDTKQ
jgi:hypothetical protein